MHRGIDRFYRDFFNRWKKNSELLEVIRFNNEEGPVRIEVFNKKAEILALKEMIMDKQILDDKNITEILDENEDKYKVAINKAKIRLNLFGQGNRKENDNWILPYCIDKWKLWFQERKSWKHSLQMLESRTNGGNVTDLEGAFKHWKRTVIKRHDYLHGLTQEALFDMDHKNHLNLVDVKA